MCHHSSVGMKSTFEAPKARNHSLVWRVYSVLSRSGSDVRSYDNLEAKALFSEHLGPISGYNHTC